MDGRGRCKDNIWIERFWRTIKQEYIYLNPAETVGELRSGISDFIKFYNYKKPHQSLDKLLPAVEYGIVALKYVNCLAMSANTLIFAVTQEECLAIRQGQDKRGKCPPVPLLVLKYIF